MKLKYPWLKKIYKQILTFYKKGNNNSLLLYSKDIFSTKILCNTICKWLLCLKPNGFYNCNFCANCILFVNNNCPDYYKIESKKFNTLGVDDVRIILSSLQNTSHQGGFKVICIYFVELITNQASNALLKILEEPNKKTFFILTCSNLNLLLPTIESRCILWKIYPLNEIVSINWILENYNYNCNFLYIRIALRLCGGFPLMAVNFLNTTFWKERFILCKYLFKSISNNDTFFLLYIYNHIYETDLLLCIISFLSDSIKWKKCLFKFLINYDQIYLIKLISLKFTINFIYVQFFYLSKFLYYRKKKVNFNFKLIFLNYLLSMEKNII